MTRKLGDAERELWERIAKTVTPLHKNLVQAAPAKILPPSRAPRTTIGTPSPVRARPAPKTFTETLDSSWDRQISRGRIQPDQVIDLHGMTAESARQLLYRQLMRAFDSGARIVLVITGKGGLQPPDPATLMQADRRPRGVIRAELPRWLGEASFSDRIAAVRRAHPRHGGAGAVYVIFRRTRTSF